MSLQSDLQQAVTRVVTDSQKLHDIVNGSVTTTVTTEGGPVKSVAKAIHDIEATINANLDIMELAVTESEAAQAAAEAARDAAEEARDQAQDAVGGVKVTNADALAGQLDEKITAGLGLEKTIQNPGANEQMHLAVERAIDASARIILATHFI